MKKIYFITGNRGKFLEVKQKLNQEDIEVIQKNFGYPEIQTETLEDVAQYGLNYLKKKINKPFILEDAGLFIENLKGFPGVYSKYVYQTIGCPGILRLLENKKNNMRKAYFCSIFAYMSSDYKPIFFRGESHGKISTDIRGNNGFGYDPIFIPNKSDKTFGEMDIKEKNLFSHRSKSIEKFIKFLNK